MVKMFISSSIGKIHMFRELKAPYLQLFIQVVHLTNFDIMYLNTSIFI